MHFKKNNQSFLVASFVAIVTACALTPAVAQVLAQLNYSDSALYNQYSDGTTQLLIHDYTDEDAQAALAAKREEEARKAEEEAKRKAEEEAAAQASSQQEAYNSSENYSESYGSDDYSYQGGNGVLTREGGVNYYNGNMETWYSQRVLPGNGLNIPGRHVAEDGTVRDGDGNIVVASDNLPYGSEVETSLGPGKVYDNGVGHDGYDLYVDW